MRLLRHQRAQHGNQLGGGNIVQLDHLGDIFVAGPAGVAVAHLHRRRAGILVLDNAYHPAGTHGRIAMHLQNGQEQLVQLILRDGLAGHHLDLALDRRVHHDGRAGRLGDKLDQLLDIGFLEVNREVLGQGRRRGQQQDQYGRKQGAAG